MSTELAPAESVGVIAEVAAVYGMTAQAFERTLLATVMPGNTKKAEVAAFLLVAKQYNLNPFTKEIYAFPAKGGIQPVVSIDGWLKLINEHPQCDGFDLEDSHDSEGKIIAVTCTMHRKDRSHPTAVTEYLKECDKGTEPWRKWPARMLRHKAMIQAARYAFGFAGIVDPDEAERFTVKHVAVEPLDADQEEARAAVIAHLEVAAIDGQIDTAWQALELVDRRLVGVQELNRIKNTTAIEAEHD